MSAYVTHGVLSGNAVERVTKADGLKSLIVTDSIEATDAMKQSDKVQQVSIDELLGEAIRRIANEESVSSLFD